jgi:ATP-dependent HslUV protease subunit HslV
MSIIVVVKKDGTVAIGADTLTKLGATCESAKYIENHSKMIKVGQNFIAHVGHPSWSLIMTRYFSSLSSRPRLDTPQSVFEMALGLHHSLKENYYLNPHEDEDDPFESSQLDCLIANPYGIFGLYSLRSVQQYARFYAFGSGYKFALGAMHAVYESDFDAAQIAHAGVVAATEFDDSCGLPVEVKTVKLKR